MPTVALYVKQMLAIDGSSAEGRGESIVSSINLWKREKCEWRRFVSVFHFASDIVLFKVRLSAGIRILCLA